MDKLRTGHGVDKGTCYSSWQADETPCIDVANQIGTSEQVVDIVTIPEQVIQGAGRVTIEYTGWHSKLKKERVITTDNVLSIW